MKDRQIFEMSGAELIEIKKKLAMFTGESDRKYQLKVFWDKLGRRLRFYPDTVRSIPSNPRRFSAIPYADDEEVTVENTPAPVPETSTTTIYELPASIPDPVQAAPEPTETYRSGGGGDYAGGGASGSWGSSSDSSSSSSSGGDSGSSSSSGD